MHCRADKEPFPTIFNNTNSHIYYKREKESDEKNEKHSFKKIE